MSQYKTVRTVVGSDAADEYTPVRRVDLGLSPQRNALAAGLSAGVDLVQGLGYSALGGLSDAVGADGVRDFFNERARLNAIDGELNGRPDLERIEDQTLGSALPFAGYQIAKQVPLMAGIFAAQAVPGLGQAATATGLARLGAVAPRVLGGGGLRAGASAAAKEAAIAQGRAFGASTLAGTALGYGSLYGESVEGGDPSPYSSLALAPLYGVAEAMVPAAVRGAFRAPAELSGGLGKRMLKAGGLGFTGESGTELFQNELEMGMRSDLSDEEKFSRRLNAGVVGGLVGGPMGSLAGIRGPRTVDEGQFDLTGGANQSPRQLGYNPDAGNYITYPDGSYRLASEPINVFPDGTATLNEDQAVQARNGNPAPAANTQEYNLTTEMDPLQGRIDQNLGLQRTPLRGYEQRFLEAFNEPSGRFVSDPATGVERQLTAGEVQQMQLGELKAQKEATAQREQQIAQETLLETSKALGVTPVATMDNAYDVLGARVYGQPQVAKLVQEVAAINQQLAPEQQQLNAAILGANLVSFSGKTGIPTAQKIGNAINGKIKQLQLEGVESVERAADILNDQVATLVAAGKNEGDVKLGQIAMVYERLTGQTPPALGGTATTTATSATPLAENQQPRFQRAPAPEGQTNVSRAATPASPAAPSVDGRSPVVSGSMVDPGRDAAVDQRVGGDARNPGAADQQAPALPDGGVQRPAAVTIDPTQYVEDENALEIAKLTGQGDVAAAIEEDAAGQRVDREDLQDEDIDAVLTRRFARSKDPARARRIFDAFMTAARYAPYGSVEQVKKAVGADFGVDNKMIDKIGNPEELVRVGKELGYSEEQIEQAFGLSRKRKGKGKTNAVDADEDTQTDEGAARAARDEAENAEEPVMGSFVDPDEDSGLSADGGGRASEKDMASGLSEAGFDGEGGFGLDDSRFWQEASSSGNPGAIELLKISKDVDGLRQSIAELESQGLTNAVALLRDVAAVADQKLDDLIKAATPAPVAPKREIGADLAAAKQKFKDVGRDVTKMERSELEMLRGEAERFKNKELLAKIDAQLGSAPAAEPVVEAVAEKPAPKKATPIAKVAPKVLTTVEKYEAAVAAFDGAPAFDELPEQAKSQITDLAQRDELNLAAVNRVLRNAPRQLTNEPIIIEGEARVVEETLGPRVAALPAPQINRLERHYGLKAGTQEFLTKVKEDVVRYATQGAEAVAGAIRDVIKSIHAGVLAVAMIFNPTGITTPEAYAIIPSVETVTTTREVRAELPAEVQGMSEAGKQAYATLIPALKGKNGDKLLVLADKPSGRIFVFDADGKLVVQQKALFGLAKGDFYKGNNDLPQNRVTPAGLFGLVLVDAAKGGSAKTTAGEYDFGKVFALKDPDAVVTIMHSVWLKEKDAGKRAAALKNSNPADSRYSFGCINVDKGTYKFLLDNHQAQMDGAKLFVVPDNQEAVKDFVAGTVPSDRLVREGVQPVTETVTTTRGGTSGNIERGDLSERAGRTDGEPPFIRRSRRVGRLFSTDLYLGKENVVGEPQFGQELRSPVTLRDGTRLDGFTSQNQSVFSGYDRNGNRVSVAQDRVDPDDVVSSRDSNRTAKALQTALRTAGLRASRRISATDQDGVDFDAVAGSLEDIADYAPGVQKGLDFLRGMGMGNALDAVDSWMVTLSPVSWDAIYSEIDGVRTVIFNVRAIRDFKTAVISTIHEVGHAIDGITRAGGDFSSDPTFNLRRRNGDVMAMRPGSVADELVNHYYGEEGGLSQLLAYPLDPSDPNNARMGVDETREELFAQVWAFSNMSGGMDFLRDNLPITAAYMEKVHEQVKATNFARPKATNFARPKATGQSAQPGQVPRGARAGENVVRASRQAADQGLNTFSGVGNALSDLLANPAFALKKIKLGFLTLEQMAEMRLPRTDLIKAYTGVMTSMQKTSKDMVNKASKIDRRWATLTPETSAKLSAVMRAATRAEFDPEKHTGDVKSAEQGNILRDFEALSSDAKQVYTETRGFYEDAFNERKAVLESVAARLGGKALKEVERMYTKMKGPYFPLGRTGDFYAIGMSDRVSALMDKQDDGSLTDAESKELATLRKDPTQYRATAHATMAEAKKASEAMRQSLGNSYFNEKSERIAQGVQQLPDFSKLEDSITAGMDKDLRVQVKGLLTQFMFDSLPEHHALKSAMRREGIHGENEDMRQVFAQTAISQAHYLSRLKFGEQLNMSLNSIRQAARRDIEMRTVENELVKRAQLSMERNESAFANALINASYFAHLGLSPAFLITNMTQVPMITAPWLAARHGLADARTAMAKALSDTSTIIKSSFAKDGWRSELDWSSKFRKGSGEDRMFTELLDRNVLDITVEHDLAAIAKMQRSKLDNKIAEATGNRVQGLGDVVQMVNTPVRITELANRAVTALSAYRLKKAALERSGVPAEAAHTQAVDYAAQAVSQTQLNYSELNAPRYMRSVLGSQPLAKMMFQFRKFQQGMVWLVFKNIADALPNSKASAEDRRVARRTLTGLYITTGLMAGTSGMPLLGTVGIAGLANLAAAAFGDDDEPWDFNTEFRNYLTDWVGPELATAISKGVPAALGMDLSKRVGMAELTNPLPFVRSGKTGQETVGNVLTAVAGAPFSFIGSTVDGVMDMAGGDVQKGFEKVMPIKGVKDLLKGYRYNDEGMTDRRGNVILPPEKFDAVDIALRGMGFAPTKEADYFEANKAVQGAKQAVADKRTSLLRQYTEARIRGEAVADVNEKIKAFNQRNPTKGVRIDESTKLKAVQARRKLSTERADSGVRNSKAFTPYVERARFAE